MEKNNSNCLNLLHLLCAQVPLIYINDSDEVNVVKQIRATIIKYLQETEGMKIDEYKKLKYYEWSLVSGLSESKIINSKGKSLFFENEKLDKDFIFKQIQDAGMGLDTVLPFFAKKKESKDPVEKSILVLKDAEDLISGEMTFSRRIREIVISSVSDLTNNSHIKTIIIVSPKNKMPKSLELYANYMNWKLPTYEEIEEIVNNTIKECKLKEINNNEIKAVINSLSGLPHYKIQENMTICMAKYMELKYEFLTELKTKYIIEKSSLEIVPNDITMEQVGGMDNLKDWISKRANAYSEEAKKYGIEPPKGVLLLGFPGCGKSLSAKTIANYLKLPLVKFDISTLFTKALGSSEENARNVTRTLEALEPCVVFIDEIEKALSGLGSSDSSDGGTTARIIGILLTWLNDRKSKNFIVATANDISNLPAPLLRKGRFDEIFFCPFPQGNEREKIFSIHLKKRGQKIDKFNLKALSNMTENYSGAEIEQIVKESMILSFSEKEELSQKYLEKAAKDCIPSYKTYKEEMDMLMDWIGWDDNRNDGIRARFASDEAKKRHGDPNKTVKGTNVISVKVPGSER